MIRKSTIALGAALGVAALVAGGVTIAAAQSDDDGSEQDVAITGDALSRASAAALAETGEGHVTGTEVGDEESYYEVEVTLDDGSQVDVQLDRQFDVVMTTEDHEDGATGD